VGIKEHSESHISIQVLILNQNGAMKLIPYRLEFSGMADRNESELCIAVVSMPTEILKVFFNMK
jgi:hypothetical protein